MRISKLYNMDIFTDTGKFLGRVQDLVLDFEKGEIVRITMEPLNAVSKEEARQILREKSVLYKNVKSVEDVVIVTKGTTQPLSESELEEGRGGFRFSK
ncbi:MAG: PRC-barrel domain-containing protein [Candidatus Micrarchaeia archaeon]